MTQQKFHRGDKVHVAKELGDSMSHFENDVDAFVIGSYQDQYGGTVGANGVSYTLLLLDPDGSGHQCSWYYEEQLTFIRHGDEADIAAANMKREQRAAEVSDLAWMCANYQSIKDAPPGPCIHALAALLNLTPDHLWGPSGEGFVYYERAWTVWHLFAPVLESGDPERVKAFAAEKLAAAGGGAR